MKKVIGIIGELAAGKDTVAEYISQQYNIPVYQISDKLKELAKNNNIGREELIQYSRKLTAQFGDEYLAKKILESSNSPISLFVGMRQVGQIEYLRKNSQLLLIGITAKPEVRFERLKKRNKPSDPQTIDELIRIDKKDDGKSVQKVSECLNMADYVLENNGEIELLYQQLNNILNNYS